MQRYVVGFAHDGEGRVALIEKNRPEWQAGKLNGIGGHVEKGEDPWAAMRREFREETGADIDSWELFVRMEFPGAEIFFFKALVSLQQLTELRTMEDEVVTIVDWLDPASWPGTATIIPNLNWLVPLAMYRADQYKVIHVHAAVAEAL